MAKKICKDCGFIGKAKKQVKGTMGTEFSIWFLALLLFFIFPIIGIVIGMVAILYSLWRMFAPSDKLCPQCLHKDTLIPLDSPIGKKMAEQFAPKEKEKEQKPEVKEVEQNETIHSFNLMDRM